jgi:integrase
LDAARSTAGEWRSLIAKGIDPAAVEAAAREQAAREAALRVEHSVVTVAQAFFKDKLAKERSGREAKRDFSAAFVTAWRDRPVSEITRLDVLKIVNAKKSTAPVMARALLILARRFFEWVVDQEVYDLITSPCDGLKVVKIIGELPSRTRRLNDAELFAFWRASGRMGYPAGAVYRMLLLTGLRLNEAAEMSWSEVHGDHIIIPAERMKGKNGKAQEHLVPLSSAAPDLIASLPRYRGAPFPFSLSAGKRPLAMGNEIKGNLDKRMLRTLRALAKRRGDDPRTVTLPRWVNHDLRRVVRSGLSALRVPHNVAEAVLAHARPGVVGTYDVHEYRGEKAEALEKWAQHVATIVSPQPDNAIATGATMIAVSVFTYSEEDLSKIKAIIGDRLGVDADRVERQITRMKFTGMQLLRHRIEVIVGLYPFHAAVSSSNARRTELIVLRREIEAMRRRILAVLSVEVSVGYGVTDVTPEATIASS